MAINHKTEPGATEATVLGPFFAHGAKEFGYGGDLREGASVKGEDVWVTGRILSVDGKPVPGAVLDVWQAKADGIYDVQTGDEFELRGRVKANDKGEYAFKNYKPKFYSIPMDGPVGDLVRATGNHHMRPAHMHAIVSAPGYQQVITHVFVEGDPYLDEDAVFAVKDSLVVKYKKVSDAEAKELGMPEPFLKLERDFHLSPDRAGAKKARKKIAAERRGRMIWRVRRVVTGHDAQGRSVIAVRRPRRQRQGDAPTFPGLALTDFWETAGAPAGNDGNADAADRPVHLEPGEERHHRAHGGVPAGRDRPRAATAARASRPSAPATSRTRPRPIR